MDFANVDEVTYLFSISHLLNCVAQRTQYSVPRALSTMHGRVYEPIKRQSSPALERCKIRELIPFDILVRRATTRAVRHLGQERRVGHGRCVER